MSDFIAALPMYDWPEVCAEVDVEWAAIRARLVAAGFDAPERLVRRNGDMPAVPGGIRNAAGAVIAPDPATLPPDELDFPTVWRHPKLLFGQACWGPLELGVARDVRVIGQPDYSEFEGGEGEFYSSAIVMRVGDEGHIASPLDGRPLIPLDLIRGRRLAFNSDDSMSGIIALTRDLTAMGESLDIFSERIESGGHRSSIVAVAEGRADVAAIDCRSWALARRFEPAAKDVRVVGWTARRKGLPYIAALGSPVTRWPL
ncbi:phosphate/phosphite/phosphonate ABC transporter substrate-binding protein [Mesorhizobium sp. ASY16-5R]|uniref:phosphate/phosphite/phosphonate ABC transporter substrate-binding protein n=1 Tax=Mesorhizobium sp. ASY16-5R TaxID=3445772 RepID=UPI003F9FCA75